MGVPQETLKSCLHTAWAIVHSKDRQFTDTIMTPKSH